MGKMRLEDVLLQEPMVADWMTDEEKKFRLKAGGYLNRAFEMGILPSEKFRGVRMFSAGESSVVFRVGLKKKYVVKMTRFPDVVENEAVLFEKWKKCGVVTPEIIGLYSASEELPVSLLMMEYISAPILSEITTVKNRVSDGISREMGQILGRMHKVKGMGFGYPRAEDRARGRYNSFGEEIQERILGKPFDWLLAQGEVANKELLIGEKAVEILDKDIAQGTSPVLAHNDLRPYNIFNTEPLTVFDPNPRITHPVFDLALSMVKSKVDSLGFGNREAQEILAGYRDLQVMDDVVLSAGMFLRALALLHTWKRKGKGVKTKRLMEIIRETARSLV